MVIAIIAILASLLLPALSVAKEQANSISCMTNQKALHLAQVYYEQDHRIYAGYRGNSPPQIFLREYAEVPMLSEDGSIIGGQLNFAPNVCPSEPHAVKTGGGGPASYTYTGVLLPFGWNLRMGMEAPGVSPKFLSSTDVTNPAETLGWSEMTAHGSYYPPAAVVYSPGGMGDNHSIYLRHGNDVKYYASQTYTSSVTSNYANAVFLDGHADKLTDSDAAAKLIPGTYWHDNSIYDPLK